MKNKTRDKKRILIFSLSYFPFIGGAEVAIKEIAKRCYDFEFDLIANRFDPKLPKFEKIENVNVYRIGRGQKWEKYFYPWLALSKSLKLQMDKDYKIVWGMLETWGGWAALKFKEHCPKVKYLLTMQSGDTDEFIKKRTWFWARRYRLIYQKADYIQAISKFLEKRARNYGYQGEIALIPNGVDLDKFKNSFSEDIISVEKLDNKKIIITVSRLEEKNGVKYLIEAIKNLSVTLLIVGAGTLEKSLKNFAKKIGVKNKVIFVGKVDHNDVPRYLALADIFVRPSLSEGLGNVFLEAMATGLPVIGTKVGGIPDFLKDGETGLFCQTKDSKNLAEKIELLIKNDALREKLIKNGSELVEKNYSWDEIALQMKVIFEKIIL